MDFDPRITSDGTGYGSGHGWHCNFHFGYGQDSIDEDVEHEKSCLQVLQLLVAKADAEIHDLEDELAILQCQLKWAESDIHKDPCELFCAVFKGKIDSLTSATERLRNDNGLSGHHMDVRLELQRPAERICDIIYGLIRPEFLELDKEEGDFSSAKGQLPPSSKSNVDIGERTAHLEAQDKVSTGKGIPKSDALQHAESEKCMPALKIGNAASSPALAEKDLTVKVEIEEDNYDLNFQLDAYDSFAKTESHKTEDPVTDHWKASEEHFGITHSRKKSSLSAILKPRGQKVRWKTQSNFGGVNPSSSSLLSEKNVRSEPSSDAETSQELGSASKVQNELHFPPEVNSRRAIKIEDVIFANPFQAKRQLRASKEGAHMKSSKVKASREMRWESPTYDLETLRLKLSKDPDYLAGLRVQDLKEILRQNKITGMTKFKKEKIIKELIKRLGLCQKLQVLYWLSGLTCTDENFIAKSGAQRAASREGVALIAMDTSPRGLNVEGEADSWDFGVGAGFYLNAKQEKWKNWRMYDYVVKELPELLKENFPELDTARASISGHSMGGHGALTIYLKNLDKYKSVSAFAPIVNPINCPWGQKAFTNYLGEKKADWEEYDATCLISKFNNLSATILIDQGDADKFLHEQLMPNKFEEACRKVNAPLLLRMQPGYDHSYYFIATFIDDHISHHSQALKL